MKTWMWYAIGGVVVFFVVNRYFANKAKSATNNTANTIDNTVYDNSDPTFDTTTSTGTDSLPNPDDTTFTDADTGGSDNFSDIGDVG